MIIGLQMKRLFLLLGLLGTYLAYFIPGTAGASVENDATTVTVPANAIPFAPDYAFTELQDAWDFSQFTDISIFLNGAGRYVSLTNPQVANGIFSATSIGNYTANNAKHFPVYPTYPDAMRTGRYGIVHPVKSSSYRCFYVAMKVNSLPYPQVPFFDGFRVMWYKNESLVPQGARPNGGTQDIKMHDEGGFSDPYPLRLWKLFKVDLTSPPGGIFTNSATWLESAEWQGIEFNPTLFSNTFFEIDWMKLANNCNSESAYQANINFSPSVAINTIWINPTGTNRNIRVATDVSGSSGQYTLDTKGFQAGSYRVGLGDKLNCCTQWSSQNLMINDPPSVSVLRPSFISGEDYATNAGNPWDMDSSDTASLECFSAGSFSNGELSITTNPPSQIPSGCRGGIGEADPKIYLNTPLEIPPNSGYRYLSFRMYQNGPWQYVSDGMIVRWIWYAGTPSNKFAYVSHEVALDVGWHTYHVDLFDTFNGTPVESQSGSLTPWKDSATIHALRLDPNENYTGNIVPALTFNQAIDWIKLTKMEKITRGQPFTVEWYSSESLPASAFQVFYTSDSAVPRQHPAASWSFPLPPAQPFRQFVPGIFTFSGTYKHFWNTGGVAPGQYYLCVEANDGTNTNISCSEAPVEVVP